MEPIVCYLMEPLVSSIHWVLKWNRIPWNLSFQILMKIILNCAGWIDLRKLINTLYLFAISFTYWCFIINICIISKHFRHYSFRIKISFNISFQCSLKLILIKKFHGTFSRVPWNFLSNIWTTPVVPWNVMEICPDLKFHGIPWNFFHTPEFHGIQWNSMELLIFPKKIPWNSMELFWSFMEFHRIPWNLINFIKKSYF